MIEHDPEALYAIMSLISLIGLAILALLYLDYWRDKRELELMAKRDEGWDEHAGITAKMKSDFADADFHIPWYRRWFPFLPVWGYDPKFRCFLFQLWDCSVTHHS